jgi:hypothetical protein
MKASPQTIMSHPNLSNSQRAVALLARFAELRVSDAETTGLCIKKEDTARVWREQDRITKAQSRLSPILEMSGAQLLKAIDFAGYRVFMRDPSGSVFPVYSEEEYCLQGKMIRVRAANKEYDHHDLRIAAVLMGSRHQSVRGTKVLLLCVNGNTFSGIYPVAKKLR